MYSRENFTTPYCFSSVISTCDATLFEIAATARSRIAEFRFLASAGRIFSATSSLSRARVGYDRRNSRGNEAAVAESGSDKFAADETRQCVPASSRGYDTFMPRLFNRRAKTVTETRQSRRHYPAPRLCETLPRRTRRARALSLSRGNNNIERK